MNVIGILDHLYRERRRLPLLGALAFVSGYGLYAHVGAMAYGLPFPVFTGIFYALVVVVAAAVTSYFLPGLRRLTDTIAVTRLIFAFWVVAAQGQDLANVPFISATIVVLGAMVLLHASILADRLCRAEMVPVPLSRAAMRTRAALNWLDDAGPRGGRAGYPASLR